MGVCLKTCGAGGLRLVWLGLVLCARAEAQFDYWPLGNGQAAITGYEGTNIVVVVPSTINGLLVTEIGGSAFAEREDIVSVRLPNTVTTIGELGPTIANGAFNDCINLTNVTLSSNLRIIGTWTFGSCWSLMSLRIPDGVTGIGNGAFYGSGLTSVTLPNSVTTLEQAFEVCYDLTNVVLSTNLSSLVYATFDECPELKSITLPASITNLEEGAFAYCDNLSGIYFEGDAPTVSSNTFIALATNAVAYYVPCSSGWDNFRYLPTAPWWDAILSYTSGSGVVTVTGFSRPCDSLRNLTIPAMLNGGQVCAIGSNAFFGNSVLTAALIPATVTNLGANAFGNCSNLAAIDFLGSPPALDSGALANDTSATVYYLPCATGWSSSFGGFRTATGWQLLFDFSTNSGALTVTGYSGLCDSVNIPTSLNGLPIVGIGNNGFLGWSNVVAVSIANSVTNIGSGAFRMCSNLVSVLLPGDLASISDYAFDSCSSLAGISIPATVTHIGTNAFAGCVTLQTVALPSGLTQLKPGAFGGCAGLDNIIIPKGVTGLENGVFYNCRSLSRITVPDTLTSIGDFAFGGCVGLRSLILPKELRTIGNSAFGGCSFLESVTLPAGLETIGAGAFYYCTLLSNLSFPTSITSIGDHAFEACVSLTNVSLSSSVTNLGNGIFADCDGLSAITVNAQNPAYSSVAGVLFNKSQTVLLQCPGGATGSFSIPSGVKSIADFAFYGCRGISAVTLPAGLTRIGNWAFDSCAELRSIAIPSSVTEIGDVAFRNCQSLSEIDVDASNPAYCSVEGVLFDKNQTTLIQYPPAKVGYSYSVPGTVNTLADWAFASSSLSKVIIGRNVGYIGQDAFWSCPNLEEVIFEGNAPSLGTDVFDGDAAVLAYYLPGTSGWSPTIGGLPGVLWNPQIQTPSMRSGFSTNGFRFTITGNTNLSVIVEASTDLAGAKWMPVATNSLNAGSISFSDPQWTNFASRYYRLQIP